MTRVILEEEMPYIFVNMLLTQLVYTTSQKILNCKIVYVFKEVSSAHQAWIYLIQSTTKNITFWNIFTNQNNRFLFEYSLKCNLFLWFHSWIVR